MKSFRLLRAQRTRLKATGLLRQQRKFIATTSSRLQNSMGAHDEIIQTYVRPGAVHNVLTENGCTFYTGVPDSLLKDFCSYLSDKVPPTRHVIAPNEGSSIALAAGSYLATGRTPLVYMQNSGIGNAINPLLSLADSKVYGIPMVVVVGWRGEPGRKDEPQHNVQGSVMAGMLASMNLNFHVLTEYDEGAVACVHESMKYAEEHHCPSVIVVRKGTFSPYTSETRETSFSSNAFSREDAIGVILEVIDEYDCVVGTTGFTSREIFETRDLKGHSHDNDFLTVGSMGHASSIALGISIEKPCKKVYCIDGDGAFLMHLGNAAAVGVSGQKNYKHILINNGVHDSVGAQATSVSGMKFADVAKSLGYKYTDSVETEDELRGAMKAFQDSVGPSFLEIFTCAGARSNLGRPEGTPAENKKRFMHKLQM